MSKPAQGNARRTVTNLLTTVAHASSPFITTFLLIHLSAPALANVGGTNLASQTMLLGREYYQTPTGEDLLVLGPIVVHAFAGICKRLVSAPMENQDPDSKRAEGRAPLHRPITSLLGLTGYGTALILLPIHFLVHRSYPALTTEPISSVGPSSLDYEYVKYGLHTWPWRSWFLYTSLLTSVALHAADGSALIWNTWFKVEWAKLSRKTRRIISVGGVVIPVLLGVAAIASEPPMIMSFLESRYQAAYTQSIAFRL